MSNLIASATTISAAIITFKSLRWYSDYVQAKRIEEKRQAFRIYVQTGKKNQAYFTLSRRAVKAAEKQRSRLIKTRSQENRTFSAVTECPQCCSLDIHYMRATLFIRCVRECKECEYSWRQDK